MVTLGQMSSGIPFPVSKICWFFEMHHIFADCGLGGDMETSLWTHCVGLADGHFGLCLHFEQDKFLRVRVTGQTI